MSKHFLFVVVLLLASCAPAKDSAPSQPTSVRTSLDTQVSTPTPIPEVTVGVVVVDVLNVREGPGTSYATTGSLNKGEKFYVLGDVMNSTNNKWLLISMSSDSFGWVAGDQSHVTVQKETVDLDTYLTWQKNVDKAKLVLNTFATNP